MVVLRLIFGIISIIIAIAFFIFELFSFVADGAYLNGGDGSEGTGFLSALIFLVAGILAITLNKVGEWPTVCAGIYGLGFFLALFLHCKFGDGGLDRMLVYGLTSIVFAGIFLFSACNSWKRAIISALVFLVALGLGFIITALHKMHS